jgi:glutamate synthase (NADPH/NADH) small chain
VAKKRTIRTIPQQRTPVREQDPSARVKNFSEVSCGYTPEDALVESDRCLLCPDQPCVRGCPVGIDIPGFIEKIGQKDFRGAYDVIAATNLLPAVCGRVCPQESQCEGVCTVGKTLEPVAIGRLERFVGDRAIAEGWTNLPYIEHNDFRVGIVGSGPAGMACAADMAKAGCDVTVYEAFHQAGGVLKYGIPDFRLPTKWLTPRSGTWPSWASNSNAIRWSGACSRSSR